MLATTGDLIPPRPNRSICHVRSGWLGISLFIMITDIFPLSKFTLGFFFSFNFLALFHRFQPEKKKIPPASAFKSVRGAMDSLLSLPTLVYSSLESAGQIVGYEEVPTSTDFSLHVHRGHRPVLVP